MEVFCGPCNFRGVQSKAEKYCLTCQELQCITCADIHRSSKATRYHLLLATTDFKDASDTTKDLETFQNCTDHPEKKLEFYCIDHEHFLCTACLLNVQKCECKTVVDIETAGEQILKETYNEQIDKDLESIVKLCKTEEEGISSLIEKSHTEREDIKRYIEGLKKKILEHLNKCEIDVLKEVDYKVKKQVANLMNLKTVLSETRTKATQNKEILQAVVSDNSKADSFRCILSITQQLNDYQEKKATTEMDILKHSVKLSVAFKMLLAFMEHNPMIQCNTNTDIKMSTRSLTLKTNKESLLRITKHTAPSRGTEISHDYTCSSADADTEDLDTVKDSGERSSRGPTHAIAEDKKAEDPMVAATNKICGESQSKPQVKSRRDTCTEQNLGEEETISEDSSPTPKCNQINMEIVNVSSTRILVPDDSSPIIDGVTTLHDGRLILSDKTVPRLIVLKENFNYDHELVLTEPAGKCAALTPETLALCFPTINTIAILSTSLELKRVREFPTKHSPVGIYAIDKNRIFISSVDNKKSWFLNVITPRGAVIVTINVKQPILDAKHISSLKLPSKYRYYLYCCNVSGSVHCVQADGIDIFRYNVKSPNGLLVDKRGFIFVVDSSGTLHVLSFSGEPLYQVSIPVLANGITYYPAMDRLVLTKENKSEISVYSLKC